MMLLKEKNPAVYKRLEFLMDGDTSDLQEKNSFSRWAFTFYIDKTQCPESKINKISTYKDTTLTG